METRQILIEELKRLNRLNTIFEKNILADKYEDEPKQVVSNILAMCEIAKSLKI